MTEDNNPCNSFGNYTSAVKPTTAQPISTDVRELRAKLQNHVGINTDGSKAKLCMMAEPVLQQFREAIVRETLERAAQTLDVTNGNLCGSRTYNSVFAASIVRSLITKA